MPVNLKPHQNKIVNFMKKSNQRGVILFHGLGSGKTITSIAISKIYSEKVLVIVPASMRTQWLPELKKMDVDLKRYKVVSYEGFLSLVESGKLENLENTVAIVDEAHRIRSAGGKISTTLVKMLQTAHKVILLTGTPMVNSPMDMSPLVNAIHGSNILPTQEKPFREKFYIAQSRSPPKLERRCHLFSAITCCDKGVSYKNNLCRYHYVKSLRRNKKILTDSDLKGMTYANFLKEEVKRINKARAIAKLNVFKPNVSEYSKYVAQMISFYKPQQNIKDFPDVTTKSIKVPMSKEQNKIYVKAQKGVNMEDLKLLKSGIEITRKSTAMNAFLNATRQISNTWNGNENTPKLNKVIQYLSKHPKPAIVYSNWIGNGIKPLASMLEKKNMSYLEFTGGMTDVKKNKVVTDYNNGKIDVLLLSSSGGEGLDLKNTRQIHIMEPHWNEAKISQVIGRGIRYKSHEALPLAQRHVSVFHWISTPLAAKEVGTDEYLYQISNQKLEEMKQFLETSIKYSVENTREQKKSKKSNQLVKMRRSLKNNRSNSPSLNMYQYLSPE